eukprot:SAG11_NODE_1459_length_4872_cov_4.776660_1_plen_111_part_00
MNRTGAETEAALSDISGRQLRVYTKPIDFLDSVPEAREADEDINERIMRLTALREQMYESVWEAQIKMKKMHDQRQRRNASAEIKAGAKVWLNVAGLDFSEFHLRPRQTP